MFEKRWQEGKPIHVLEFFYPLMVGYDSVVLDVDFELGGTDQEFNMLAGRTLQKAYGKREKFVMTTKLLLGTDGRKMSKTYENCVYIDDKPGEMYGKLMSASDNLIVPYFECCTDADPSRIKEIAAAIRKGANPVEFKKELAHTIVAMYYGNKAADEAADQFTKVFSKKGTPDDMPEVKVKKGELLVDVLVRAKIVPSKSEARRLVDQKGIHMNDKVIDDFMAKAEGGIVKVGKRKWLRVIL